MKKVGLGFWGMGMIGKTHLESLRLMQVMFSDLPEITAEVLCTRKPEPYKEVLFRRVTSDAVCMLEDEHVTMVDMPSPNHVHYAQAMDCIRHGKDMYLEKPIAVNLTQAAELVRCAEQSGLVNRVALLYRYIPAIAAMKDHIANGEIGELIHFNMRFYHYSYLNPLRPISWRQQAALSGGGSMMDLGIHFADIIHWMLGPVAKVNALQKTVNTERYTDNSCSTKIPNDTEEWCCALLQLENGICGTLESSRVSAHIDSGTTIEVYGTKGAFRFDVSTPGVLYKHDIANGKIELLTSFESAGAYSAYLAGRVPPSRDDAGFFLNAHIASLKSALEEAAGADEHNPEPADFRQACYAQRIVEMIMRAAEENRTVDVSEFSLCIDEEYEYG